MSGVVLRCPTCGTTQGTPGECEACFGDTVRYFCDNHTPGLWLDTPKCAVCGATVGTAAPKTSERGGPVGATVPVHATRRPGATRTGMAGRSEPGSARPRRPSREVEIDDAPASPSLSDLFGHLSTERERAPFEVEGLPAPATERELPRRAPFLGGCLLRLLLLVLLVIVLAVSGLLVVLRGIFQ